MSRTKSSSTSPAAATDTRRAPPARLFEVFCLEAGKKAPAGKSAHAEAPGGAVTPKAGGGSAGVSKGGQGEGEHHPHIHAALRELHEAARELKEAAHDFSGHREDALKASDVAMEQLRKALEFDKK